MSKPGWFRFDFHHGPGHQGHSVWFEYVYEPPDRGDSNSEVTEWMDSMLQDRLGHSSNWTGKYRRVSKLPKAERIRQLRIWKDKLEWAEEMVKSLEEME